LHGLKREIRLALAESWQRDAKDIGGYLQAAAAQTPAKHLNPKRLAAWSAALKNDKLPLEDPLHPWSRSRAVSADAFPSQWQTLTKQYQAESQQRAEFNAKHFVSFGDLQKAVPPGWQASGQGLAAAPSGDFASALDGDAAVTAIYPAGSYTHLLSTRLNGVLRSPLLPATKKYVSFHALGGKTSAVRLVSNNCQLNYVNYKALTKNEFEWKRFPIGDEANGLRTYAELLTKFDNPKFPDQLGTLGGDTLNSRVPWEEAMRDPHSYFGITRAVLHDCEETPRDELAYFTPLFAGHVKNASELSQRYSTVASTAIKAWAEGRATDDDVRWLDTLVRRGLLSNERQGTPKLDALLAQYRDLEKQLAMPRIIPGLAESGSPFEQPVLLRGDFRKPGELTSRRYLDVLSAAPFANGSGRLELAEQIASQRNPLTARVMVNRIWHHLFGTGIVRTVDDFGHVGEAPSHPELLDYLSRRFVEDGWSVKKLIRSIVMAEAFRQANRANPQAGEVDPQNRLLHHYPARRLEAEAIRDVILAASGRLDAKLFGPSVHPYRDKPNEDRRLFPGPLDGDGRRSIYIKTNLMEAPKFLGVFNFPGGKVTQGRRDITNVPAQALALLNDPFVLQQADVWAKRLVARPDSTLGVRLEHMFQKALGRPMESDERQRFEHAVHLLAEFNGVPTNAIMASEPVWRDVAHALYNLKEFIYVP
jgi:hypothetical protein